MVSESLHNKITVEVAYALPDHQKLVQLQVEEGCTAMEAVQRSAITEHFPDIDLATVQMGIFSRHMDGKVLPLPSEYRLKEWDRIEIYRPLLIDPKEARAERARKAREKKQGTK